MPCQNSIVGWTFLSDYDVDGQECPSHLNGMPQALLSEVAYAFGSPLNENTEDAIKSPDQNIRPRPSRHSPKHNNQSANKKTPPESYSGGATQFNGLSPTCQSGRIRRHPDLPWLQPDPEYLRSLAAAYRLPCRRTPSDGSLACDAEVSSAPCFRSVEFVRELP